MKKLKVIFRKFKEGEILALFPTELGTNDWLMCNSYMHIGQHGSASVFITENTTLAKENEYTDLLKELQSIYHDFHLVIAKKITQKDNNIRIEKLKL